MQTVAFSFVFFYRGNYIFEPLNLKTFLGEQTPPRRSTFSPKSLFRSSNGLKELPEMRFEVLFNLIGKSTMAFLTGQSWRVLKSWYKGKGGGGEAVGVRVRVRGRG